MKKIYIVRHGETNWNLEGKTQGWQDSSLTERGLKQATLLGERLKEEKIEVIFTSNLDRAKTTANIVAEKLKVPCHYREELKEMGFGLWEGLTIAELQAKYPLELEDWHNRPHICKIPNGEELSLVQARMVKIFNDLQTREENNILLVSHGTVIKLLLMSILNMPLRDYYKLKQNNCAVNLIQYKNRGPVLIKYNDTSYMEILLKGDKDED